MPVLTPTDYPLDLLGSTAREGGSWLRRSLSAPPSPERTRRIVDRLRQSGARMPVAAGAPEAVIAAHKQFIARVDEAEAAADVLEAAQAAVDDALRTDVGHAGTLKKGVALVASALKRPAARDAAEVAEVACLASEGKALAALQELLEVVREHWQDWRETLEQEAGTAIDDAQVAFSVAAVAIARRGEALERVNELDWEIANRFPEAWESTGRDITRDGGGHVVLPGQPHPRAAHSYLGMGAEIEALRTGLTVAYPWAPPATPPPDEVGMIVEYGGAGDLVGKKVRA